MDYLLKCCNPLFNSARSQSMTILAVLLHGYIFWRLKEERKTWLLSIKICWHITIKQVKITLENLQRIFLLFESLQPFSLHDMGAWLVVVARYDVIMVEWLAIEGDTRADVGSDVLYCYEPCSWSLQSHRIWGTGEIDKCYTFFLFQRETYLKYLISHSTRMWYSYSWHFASYLHPAVLIKL